MTQTTVDWAARPTVFLRNATGLVKAWSAYDAFIYSFISVNLVTLGLYGMSKTMGWEFYNAANSLYWNSAAGTQGAPSPVIPVWPYPVLLASWLVDSHAVQFPLILAEIPVD